MSSCALGPSCIGKLKFWVCRSQKLNMLPSSNLQLSLFLTSTKSYLKFRTIRGTPQKWVGFGKPLYLERAWVSPTLVWSTEKCDPTDRPTDAVMCTNDVTQNFAWQIARGQFKYTCYIVQCIKLTSHAVWGTQSATEFLSSSNYR